MATVPQITDHLSSEEGMCALGMLANYAGLTMQKFMNNPEKMIEHFNCSISELNRRIHCPECNSKETVFWLMPHMNDVHKSSFKQIGEELEKYNL